MFSVYELARFDGIIHAEFLYVFFGKWLLKFRGDC